MIQHGEDIRTDPRIISPLQTHSFSHFFISYIDAYTCIWTHKHQQTLQLWNTLNQTYPNHILILQQLGNVQLQLNDGQLTRQIYEQLHEIEPYLLDGMDILALLYKKR